MNADRQEQRWSIVKSPRVFGGIGQVHGPDTETVDVVPAERAEKAEARVKRLKEALVRIEVEWDETAADIARGALEEDRRLRRGEEAT